MTHDHMRLASRSRQSHDAAPVVGAVTLVCTIFALVLGLTLLVVPLTS
jgi:hypothetical protein